MQSITFGTIKWGSICLQEETWEQAEKENFTVNPPASLFEFSGEIYGHNLYSFD